MLPPDNKSMCSFYTERDTEKRKEGGRETRRRKKALRRSW